MPTPLIPARGPLALRPPMLLSLGCCPWDSTLGSSLLSVQGEGLQRETEIRGHWHHVRLLEGLAGRLEGTRGL